MGSSKEDIEYAQSLCPNCDFSIEQPQHSIFLDQFQIGKYEITNRQYAQCVKVGRCRGVPDPGVEKEMHPVVKVSWNDAKEFCEWVGGRLPTEAEWEKAASWDDGAKTKHTYPWGGTSDCTYANYAGKEGGNDTCVGDTMPVGSYESVKSPYGLYDMAGNASEWVSSLRMPYPYDADDGREEMSMSSTDVRVLRGGSWGLSVNFVRSVSRSGSYPTLNFDAVGFRCSRSP